MGVVADHRVNADDALTVGADNHERLTKKRFGDVKMTKKDQAQTFSIMRKPIKVDSEYVRMSPAQLYHRLLSIASTNGPPDRIVPTSGHLVCPSSTPSSVRMEHLCQS